MIAKYVDLAALAVLIAAVPAALIACGWYWWRHGRPATIERLSPLWRGFLVVTMAQIICYYTAIDKMLAAAQLLVWLGYLAVFYLVRLTPRRWTLTALRVLGWVVAVVCLIEFFSTGRRAGVWLQGNPNKVGGLLAVLFPMADVSLWVFVCCAALVATGSRGAVSGVIASVIANVATVRKKCIEDELALVFIVVVVLVVVILFVVMRPSTIGNRLENWREAVDLFSERPWTGWGPGCYTLLAQNEPQHPHADSWLLTVAAEMGRVGVAAWGWLAVEVYWVAARSPGRARLALVAFAVHNLVDATFWWWWIGIVVMACLALLEDSSISEEV